jgi:hypothetical protein
MSKLGSIILFAAVLALGSAAMFLGVHAASQPFAIHMALFVIACAVFLVFVGRRMRSE